MLYSRGIMKKTVYLILNNIRSTHNVGSIFRTADGAGVTKIYLTGYTPQPIDRFGRHRSDIAKVALGAEKSVSWEYRESIEALLAELKQQEITIVGLEQDERSVQYRDYQVPRTFALILGNEPEGIEESIRKQCDALVEIPMYGEKESLNVSVAAGIAVYQLAL